MLFVITHSSTRKNKSTGKSLGMLSMLLSIKALTDANPVAVSMFAYIDVASAVKISAFFGRVMVFNSSTTVKELCLCNCTKGRSCFILKSSQVEKTASSEPEVLTTGLRVTGDLCTLGKP